MNGVNALALVLIVATIVDFLSTAILSHLAGLALTATENELTYLAVHVALGIVAAFTFDADLFRVLGITAVYPALALVLSGLVYASGANAVAQLLAALKAIGASWATLAAGSGPKKAA